jgi:hypothetical protein
MPVKVVNIIEPIIRPLIESGLANPAGRGTGGAEG